MKKAWENLMRFGAWLGGTFAFLLVGCALVFVLVCLRGRAVYRVPWEVWWRMKEHFGHKYMTAEELEPYRVQMRRGVILFLGDPE